MCLAQLEFTPLEFETHIGDFITCVILILEFTPLEFETVYIGGELRTGRIRIYSVGV